jgi:hypothetical protein
MRAEQTQQIEALHAQAAALTARAEALNETYRRTTWFRFTMVFFPVPFTVLLLRFNLEGWHYIIAGVAYMVFSAVLYAIDGAASRKCDDATRAAGRARQAYELASHPSAHHQMGASPTAS